MHASHIKRGSWLMSQHFISRTIHMLMYICNNFTSRWCSHYMIAVTALSSWGLESWSFSNRKAAETLETGIFWQGTVSRGIVQEPSRPMGLLADGLRAVRRGGFAWAAAQRLGIFQRSKAEGGTCQNPHDGNTLNDKIMLAIIPLQSVTLGLCPGYCAKRKDLGATQEFILAGVVLVPNKTWQMSLFFQLHSV